MHTLMLSCWVICHVSCVPLVNILCNLNSCAMSSYCYHMEDVPCRLLLTCDVPCVPLLTCDVPCVLGLPAPVRARSARQSEAGEKSAPWPVCQHRCPAWERTLCGRYTTWNNLRCKKQYICIKNVDLKLHQLLCYSFTITRYASIFL